MPPTTRIASTLTETSNWKLCGNTEPTIPAKMPPASPANAAPIV